ncbi:hypothetical protein PN836_014765 [Ningiella sp. W23]|uniref:hypothetical protein n=1 Tax=Ningiella sp. W23 TaxID=3023715 RepID=UPI003756B0E6
MGIHSNEVVCLTNLKKELENKSQISGDASQYNDCRFDKTTDFSELSLESIEERLDKAIKSLEAAEFLEVVFTLLSLCVTFIGFGVGVNLLAKASTETKKTQHIYDVPEELYRKINKLEIKQNITNVLLVFIAIVLLVGLFVN